MAGRRSGEQRSGLVDPELITLPLSFAALCAALMVSNTRWDWQGDFIVGIAVAVFLYFLRTLDQRPKGAWFSLGHRLAAFSFSLYALHFPLNKLVLSLFVPERVRHAGPREWLGWTAIVLAEAFVCWVFYWLFERRTPALRKALLRIIFPAGKPIQSAANSPLQPVD